MQNLPRYVNDYKRTNITISQIKIRITKEKSVKKVTARHTIMIDLKKEKFFLTS
jgi:hypothetical protein